MSALGHQVGLENGGVDVLRVLERPVVVLDALDDEADDGGFDGSLHAELCRFVAGIPHLDLEEPFKPDKAEYIGGQLDGKYRFGRGNAGQNSSRADINGA